MDKEMLGLLPKNVFLVESFSTTWNSSCSFPMKLFSFVGFHVTEGQAELCELLKRGTLASGNYTGCCP